MLISNANLPLGALTVAAITASRLLAAEVNAQVSLTQEMRIDGTAQNLVYLGWVIPWGNVIAVGQTRDRSVSFFDSTGRLVGTFGRPGQGPGEFGSTGQAGLVGDSLRVYDLPARARRGGCIAQDSGSRNLW